MKRRTIRGRFFGSLAIYTLVNFLLITIALISFDIYEYVKNPDLLEEEGEEVLVVGIVMLVLYPVSLAAAWHVARWLLRPWRSMVVQAENISRGRFEKRITVEHPSDEVGRLAAMLNRTFDEYQELVDRMQRFSYDASHQLRNPLAAIRTKSEVCLMHPRTEEEYRETVADILESTVRMSRTVSQLLLLARAAGGALDDYHEPIDLREMSREVVDEAVMIGELKSITVEFVQPTVSATVRGVPDLIREALSNLVDNALKFTPAGGHIKVELAMAESASSLRLEVSDSGPGLTGSQRAAIFRPFHRSSETGREGTGLGLAIVADVCQAHNGRCGVEASDLGGCCFWMELPMTG